MGATTVRNAVQIGRSAEYLVCGALELMGFQTALCNGQGFDIAMWADDGESYRVEVKATRASRGFGYTFATSTGSKKKKPMASDASDIVALVCLDKRMICFRDVVTIKNVRTTIKLDEFLQCEASQLRAAIASVKARRNS